MKIKCDIIRDLLPLYADDACSEDSRKIVEEHLAECPECGGMLRRLQSNEIETGLRQEKQDVIEYGVRRFKRRTATVGSTVSGLFMIPILVCLIINLRSGSAMGWFLIVLASLAVAASVIIVPIIAPRDKLFWTLCAFMASVIILLAITCLVSGGSWFWVASSAFLFGMAVCFLPFAIRAKPLQKWVGKTNKVLLVLAADGVLFLNMMNMIRLHSQSGEHRFLLLIGVAAGIALVVLNTMRNKGEK